MSYIRKLNILLAISGSLNIIFIAIFFYLSIKERPPNPYFELKPATQEESQASLAIDYSDSVVIRYFRRMPMEWLISRLNNTQLVENGYTQRDLALASLVTFHHFDLDKALKTIPENIHGNLQKRLIRYGKFRDGTPADLVVYPALSEKHFDAILRFADKEKWPLTTKGLFLALQKEDKNLRDPSMMDAMMMSFEFNVVEMLFNRNTVPVEREELLGLILEGDFTELSNFVEHQKIAQDLTAAKRQAFLMSYIQHKSKNACLLLLKTDENFASKKLDDAMVLAILKLLDEKTQESEKFALAVLSSPRSDEVLKIAATKLYQYREEALPEKDLVGNAMIRFVPASVSANRGAKLLVKENPQTVSESSPKIDSSIKNPQNISNNNLKNSSNNTVANQISNPKIISSPVKSSPLLSKTSQNLNVSLPKTKIESLKTVQNTKPVLNAPPEPRKVAIQTNSRQNRYYVVQEGDSLWKISRKFNVEMEVIRVFNQLDSDVLRPGRTLHIPK